MFLKSQGGSIFSLELYSVDIQTFDNRTEKKHTILLTIYVMHKSGYTYPV